MEPSSSSNPADLVDGVYTTCWNEFNDWYCIYASQALPFNTNQPAKDLQDEEDFDESVYHRIKSDDSIRRLPESSTFILYHDDNFLDLEDDWTQPEPETSSNWIARLTTNPIPRFNSFTPVRQMNYIRGDLWTDETGANIRLIPRLDESTKLDPEQDLLKQRFEEEAMGVQMGTIVNAEFDDGRGDSRESMPFVPPEMNGSSVVEHYAGMFHDIESWRLASVRWDNNEDIVAAEAVRRLLFVHRMDEETINRTKVLPRSVQSLYKILRNRTYPDLDTLFPRDPPLPALPLDEWWQVNEESTLEDRVREQTLLICHRIDCQGVMCPTHYRTRQRAEDCNLVRGPGPQTPRWSEPKLTASRLLAKFKREKRVPCGPSCFRSLEADPGQSDLSDDIVVLEDQPELDPRVVADIKTIWKVDSDAVPCDVAVLGCDKFTCRQAYLVRCQTYTNLVEPESDSDDSSVGGRRSKNKGKAKVERKKEPALEECDHPGPCVGNMACTCFFQGRHCLRDCKCDVTCKQRRTGCSCRKSSSTNICREDRCKCFKNNLECDPDLCIGCSARDGYPCMNVSLLMRTWKPTVVKPSEFGNGLFLGVGCSAVKDELISDYMGDIVYEREATRRSDYAVSTQRNYLFDLRDADISYDAGFIGNESRFANHPNNGVENCQAKYMYVGGERRIGIYATKHIYEGQELLLNYGQTFFVNGLEKGGGPGERAFDPSSEPEVEAEDRLYERASSYEGDEYTDNSSDVTVD